MGRLDWLVPGTTPLTRQDAGFLERESAATPMHVMAITLLAPRPGRGPVTLEEVRDHVARRLPHVPTLHHRLLRAPAGMGRPRWGMVSHMDVAAHVSPWPDVAGTGRTYFDEGIAAMAAAPLARDRPLWHLWVGAPLDDGAVPLALAFHHAMADGGLARRLVGDLLTTAVGEDAPEVAAPRLPSPWALAAVGAMEAARARLSTTRARGRIGAGQVATGGADPDDALLAGPVGAGRRVRTFDIPLADLRAAAASAGATVNDVYVAAVAAGLRELLAGRGADPGEERVVALLPRDMRTESDQATIGNRTGTMFVDLPVHLADPRQRLAAVRQATADAKAATGSAGTGQFRFDVTISNVRMMPQHHVCAGATAAPFYATAPLQGRNRLVTLGLSHADVFTLTCTADAAAFPDLDVLAGGARTGFRDLTDRTPR